MLLNIDITSTVLRLCPHTFSLICIYSNEIISSLHAIPTRFLIKSTYKRIISKHYSLPNVLIQMSSSKNNSGYFTMKEKQFSLWIEKQWRIKSAFEIGRKTRHGRERGSNLSLSLSFYLPVSANFFYSYFKKVIQNL